MKDGETQAAKRKRITTACHTCQKKKIKCDGNDPCAYCVAHDIECVFSQLRQRGGSRRGAKYMNAIEDRLATMESLLNRTRSSLEKDIQPLEMATQDSSTPEIRDAMSISTVIPVTVPPPTCSNHELSLLEDSVSQNSFHASPESTERSRMTDRSRDGDREEPTDSRSKDTSYSMNALGPNSGGAVPSIRPTAGFSIFSPKGIQWVIEKTGNTTFKDAMLAAARDEETMDYWTKDTFDCVFTRHIFRQLPPKEETISIVEKYFRDFNSVCPLFSESTFMALLERHYGPNPYDSVGWWASLNVVIAITLMLQAFNNAPQTVVEKSRDYLRNALSVLTELTIRSTDILGVQALLAMALLMQGTPDPRPVAFLIASAMRLSHTLGLHKRESSYNMNPLGAEQRKRVFWIAYRIDKDLCIRSGLPLIQDDDDMNLDLPSENPLDGLGYVTLPHQQGRFQMFRMMAEFAMIQAKVHKRLYSASVSEQSDEELLITIGELDHQLEEWKERIPFDLDQPDPEMITAPNPHCLHIIVLHFSYYNCLHTIHRTSIQHSYWTSRPNDNQASEAAPLNPRVFQSAALCSASARASIRLIKYIPVQDMGFTWRVLYFPVSAFITLFASVLQTPTDSRARSDLRLMRTLVDFLSTLHHQESRELKRIFKVCSEFERAARDVVDRAENINYQRKDRKWSSSISTEKPQIPDRDTVLPLSANIGNSLNYSPPSMYNGTTNQNFMSALDDSFMTNQLSHNFPGLVAEIQPVYPNGLAMPWNGSTFHGSFPSDPTGSYGFELGING